MKLFLWVFLLVTFYSVLSYSSEINLIKQKAEEGDVSSQYILGQYFYNEDDIAKAKTWFERAAIQNHPEAQCNLGTLYYSSYDDNPEPNYAESFKWFKKSVEIDAKHCANNLGWMYQNGFGTPTDYEKAFQLYKRLPKDTNALEGLGTLYKRGLGVKEDLSKAKDYYKQAMLIDPSNPIPSYNYAKMIIEQAKEDEMIVAINLLHNAAENGLSDAAVELARIYKLGLGVKKDKRLAKGWINKADEMKVTERIKPTDAIYTSGIIKEIKISIAGKPDDYGNFHALVIGINTYQNDKYSNLKTAVNDAEKLSEVLEEKYNFKVKLAIDPKREEIIDELYNYRKVLKKDDNFLLYYAGHGAIDKDINRGYWLPSDAKNTPSNWIPTSEIIDQIKAMKARHIIVIADSCFSGTLTRGLELIAPQGDNQAWIEKIKNKKSRHVFTSGGIEPVTDSGFEGHSIFAYHVINYLKDNASLLVADSLFDKVKIALSNDGYDQTPLYNKLNHTGNEGGAFIFVPSEN